MWDPCPCGSELALNDCCVSKEIARIRELSVNSSKHHERREWAAGYINYKTIINEQILEEQENYVASIGREITCKAGCSMCCMEFIAARLEECDAIVMYMYSFPKVMTTFLKNYDTWYQRLTSGDNVLDRLSDAYQTLYETRKKEVKEHVEELFLCYAKRYTPCPFLAEQKCLIYPVRPFVCSLYSVVSDKKYCDPKWHMEAHDQQQKIKSAIHPLSFENSYFTDLKGRIIFGPMPKMIHDILEYGSPSIK